MSFFNDYGSWQRLLHDLNLDWIVRRINKNTEDIKDLKQSTITPNINATASVDNTTGNPDVNVSKDIIDDTTTFNFAFSGLKGVEGPAGSPGEDGFSPVVSVNEVPNGHTVTITDKTGSKEFTVTNGNNGEPGPAGSPGEDGFSPVVSVNEVPNGHTVTITDKTGSKEFTVTNGNNGEPGPAGPAGPSNVESYESTGRAIANINGTDIKIPNIYPNYLTTKTARLVMNLEDGIKFQQGCNNTICQAFTVSDTNSIGIKHINTAFRIPGERINKESTATNIIKLASITHPAFEIATNLINACNVYYDTPNINYQPVKVTDPNITPFISIKVENDPSTGVTKHNIYLELQDMSLYYGITEATNLYVIVDITYM